MAEEEQRHEIVARFDSSGESIVLAESDDDSTPTVQAGEARVEVDPLVEAFARSPYDPVIGYFLAIGMIGQLVAIVYFGIDAGRLGIGISLPSVGLALAMAVGGVLLL